MSGNIVEKSTGNVQKQEKIMVENPSKKRYAILV